ncbi:MAG: ABC transporter ATP-binding protein [Chloroflexi bacterium RBG_16_50_11]|nr:MAG: ABC transporter ATP-binding protein [Chloroflexi bacterium RBG_16_50_11]
MHLLEGKGVSIHFGGLMAVSDVDFYVDEGEVVGLIGPNGAGKTTLFNLISAALQPKPGEIRFKGQKINGFKPYKICRLGIARTFQIVKVFGSLPVIENVRIGSLFGSAGRISPADIDRKVSELLEFMGLSDVAYTPVKDLTLAHQKRLEVARALATQPSLLMLDELMAGLNPTELNEAMELVKKIRDSGITIIMIEHVMKAIMNICDRIIVLNYGKKLAEGTPQEIANSKTVIEVYLGEKSDAGN